MINIEFKNIDKLREQFDPRTVDQALVRTINGIASKGKTRISREVREVYNVKAGSVAKTLKFRRANYRRKSAILEYVGGKIGLAEFGLRVRKVKVEATSKKGKKFRTTRLQSRVKVRKKSGLKVAQTRFAKGFATKDKKRIYARQKGTEKLKLLMGPSVPEMVDDRNVIDVVNGLIQQDFDRDFKTNMEFYLGKKVGLY